MSNNINKTFMDTPNQLLAKRSGLSIKVYLFGRRTASQEVGIRPTYPSEKEMQYQPSTTGTHKRGRRSASTDIPRTSRGTSREPLAPWKKLASYQCPPSKPERLLLFPFTRKDQPPSIYTGTSTLQSCRIVRHLRSCLHSPARR